MSFGFGFGFTKITAAIRAAFSPSSLFAANEPGVWYDPSDLSTLFQDSAGTTPVTAVEQPVGLMLDKSKGLVLGPELMTNGTFDTDVSGWAISFGTPLPSWSSGRMLLSGNGQMAQAISVVSGKRYQISVDITVTSGTGGFGIGTVSNNAAVFFSGYSGTSRTVTASFLATTSTVYAIAATNAIGQTYFDNISVREIPGNHAYQTTATSRPVLRQDGNDKYYLYFDGVDDFLVTPTITPGIDKVQVFAGVRKMSDAAAGAVAELSANINSNNGAFYLFAPVSTSPSGDYTVASRGSVSTMARYAVNAPNTSTVTLTADIAGDLVALRTNGVSRSSGTGDQGTGNYLAYPLYIGRRGGVSYPFNGHLYSLIVRFGANLPIETIEKTEKYINSKTRAY